MDMDVIEAEQKEAADLETFNQVVIGRAQVERWFGEPYWNDVIRVRSLLPFYRLLV
jgi:hypothetical protein